MEIPIINYLSTPVKVRSNIDSFNNSSGAANSKVISKHNYSYIVKIDEFMLSSKTKHFKRFEESVFTNHAWFELHGYNFIKRPYQKSNTIGNDKNCLQELNKST